MRCRKHVCWYPAVRDGHHELVTNGRLKVELPESVWEFAREFGLDAQLENDLARAKAA